MNVIIVLILSYLFCSIPFGYLIGRTKKIDIRKTGSGNIGATNIYRNFGLPYAMIVGVLDVAKGVIPTAMGAFWFHDPLVVALIAGATLCGHIFPIFLRGKGGKGVATFAGTLIIILGVNLFLIVFLSWIVSLLLTKIMSLTNLLISLSIPMIVLFLGNSPSYFFYTLFAVCLIWWTHRSNIRRLLNGTEKKLRLGLEKQEK